MQKGKRKNRKRTGIDRDWQSLEFVQQDGQKIKITGNEIQWIDEIHRDERSLERV